MSEKSPRTEGRAVAGRGSQGWGGTYFSILFTIDTFYCLYHVPSFCLKKKKVSKYLCLFYWGIIDIVKLHKFKIDLFDVCIYL